MTSHHPRPRNSGRRVQLHRAISKIGLGSRNQAKAWIETGEIAVDGVLVTNPLTWVDLDRQTITRRGKTAPRANVVTLALHKPRGIVTTRSDELGRPTVYDLLPPGLPYVFPAGRLDADSEGLLILTNDSALAVRLTDPEHHLPKTYRVTVTGRIDDAALDRLRSGVELHDGPTRPVEVEVVGTRGPTTTLEIVLTEGRNRQVRRMLAEVGHRVRRLIRIAIGKLSLESLAPGESRVLGPDEIP